MSKIGILRAYLYEQERIRNEEILKCSKQHGDDNYEEQDNWEN